jgi:acetyl-CoA acyltransferase 1
MPASDAAVAQPVVTVESDTPPDGFMGNASQQSIASLPSTEGPASPAEPDHTLKSELNDDRASASVIPSSLTPPPSSQVPTNGAGSRAPQSSQRQRILSPPVTGLNTARHEATPSSLFTAPRPEAVVAASPDTLRAMLQSCIAEHTRLKTEVAHHKLQYQLLSVRADEDAHRAAVEQELTLRQLEALRRQKAEAPARPARKEPSPSPEISQAMYDQLRNLGEKAIRDNEKIRRDYEEACRRLKAAKKLIVRQEEEMDSLREENELLRTRLQDKRDLWNQLASPGGMFHTPKTTQASPAQYRGTPRQTPKHRDGREGRQEPFAVLLQAATQENGSAPSTPATPNRPGGRHPLKHSRGMHSLSSLPTTPNPPRPRGSDLLPAADLVPHTEPTRRFANRGFIPETPERGLSFARNERPERAHQSRESTISADDNQELARAALQSVAQQVASFASRGSPPPRRPLPSQRSQHTEADNQVYESQASQEASAMLRRDPRESFEVASSHNSRDVTPTPIATEKSQRMQSTLRGPINKSGLSGSGKRKFESSVADEARRAEPVSPTKRLRLAGGLREASSLIGLGIRD